MLHDDIAFARDTKEYEFDEEAFERQKRFEAELPPSFVKRVANARLPDWLIQVEVDARSRGMSIRKDEGLGGQS